VPGESVKHIPATASRRILILALCLAALVAAPDAAAFRPFETAIADPTAFDAPTRDTAFQHVADAGAGVVRLAVSWSRIAPAGTVKPDGFDARDPLDPAYRFEALDEQVVAATGAGLQPIVTIVEAPRWAERGDAGRQGGRKPDPAELGAFAEAVARRYSGSVLDLPRVRYWQAWNEPNIHLYLMPQFKNTPLKKRVKPGTPAVSPVIYRKFVNVVSRAVRAVRRSNKVIAGGLAPFGHYGRTRHAVKPIRFMREFLCMKTANRPDPHCNAPRFDIWSTHPYTEGGPLHSASVPGNVSLGDLPEMRQVLDAARRQGRIRRNVRFWVTEFSWDTRPPDKKGVPMFLHARWLSEAFFRMWQQGVSLVTWFKIRDETEPIDNSVYIYESGLYFNCGEGCYRAKRSFKAFRFPFIAFHKNRRVKVWGRTPGGTPGTVVIEQHQKHDGWRRLKKLRTDGSGIFRARPKRHGFGEVRARMTKPARERSLAFGLWKSPDADIVPFGTRITDPG
jgi:hypothetical protein